MVVANLVHLFIDLPIYRPQTSDQQKMMKDCLSVLTLAWISWHKNGFRSGDKTDGDNL
jgi:hypothetical protein